MLLRPSNRRYHQLTIHPYLVSSHHRRTRNNLIITCSYANLPYGYKDFTARCIWNFHPPTLAPIHVESKVHICPLPPTTYSLIQYSTASIHSIFTSVFITIIRTSLKL